MAGLALGGAALVGLVAGLARAGYGLDYLNTSHGALTAVQGDWYNPFAAGGINAPYPPYLFSLLAPTAYSWWGSLLWLVLNAVAPLLLMWRLRAGPAAALLLVLSPQSVANLVLNNAQFVAVVGLALLLWCLQRVRSPWMELFAGISLMLMTLKPNQLLLAPLVLALRRPGVFVFGAALFGLLLAWSFAYYGFWVPIWIDYVTTVPMVSGDYDSLLRLVQQAGAPNPVLWVVQSAVMLLALVVLWCWRGQTDPRPSLAVALAAGNLAGVHSNIISTLPLVAVTFALLPLRWTAVLWLTGWGYTLLFNVMTGQYVVGYLGVVPLVCLGLLALHVRRSAAPPMR